MSEQNLAADAYVQTTANEPTTRATGYIEALTEVQYTAPPSSAATWRLLQGTVRLLVIYSQHSQQLTPSINAIAQTTSAHTKPTALNCGLQGLEYISV